MNKKNNLKFQHSYIINSGMKIKFYYLEDFGAKYGQHHTRPFMPKVPFELLQCLLNCFKEKKNIKNPYP